MRNFGESEPDVHAVAAPIVDARGSTPAAITVSAPPSRLSEQEVPAIAEQVRSAAAKIGGVLPG